MTPILIAVAIWAWTFVVLLVAVTMGLMVLVERRLSPVLKLPEAARKHWEDQIVEQFWQQIGARRWQLVAMCIWPPSLLSSAYLVAYVLTH